MAATLKYATTSQLAQTLKIKREVPMWDVGSTPTYEELGTGTGSIQTFYTDQRNIVAGTYTFYYGATSSSVTALTETTHYTLDKTKGKFVMTTAGATLISTNKVWGEYAYCFVDISDDYISTVLFRAEVEVDNVLNATFTDGTASYPAYSSRTEYQYSRTRYTGIYFSDRRPLKDVSSDLAADLTAVASSLTLTTGEGVKFPSIGTVIIEEEIITYTGATANTLTGLTRGVGDSTGAAHVSGKEIHTTVVELSDQPQGVATTWSQLEHGTDVDVDASTGRILIYNNPTSDIAYAENIYNDYVGIAKRFKLTYLYGFDTIPLDITRLTILFAKRMLVADTITSSLFQGRNEFTPEMQDADLVEINQIIKTRAQQSGGRT